MTLPIGNGSSFHMPGNDHCLCCNKKLTWNEVKTIFRAWHHYCQPCAERMLEELEEMAIERIKEAKND